MRLELTSILLLPKNVMSAPYFTPLPPPALGQMAVLALFARRQINVMRRHKSSKSTPTIGAPTSSGWFKAQLFKRTWNAGDVIVYQSPASKYPCARQVMKDLESGRWAEATRILILRKMRNGFDWLWMCLLDAAKLKLKILTKATKWTDAKT